LTAGKVIAKKAACSFFGPSCIVYTLHRVRQKEAIVLSA